MSPHAVTNPYAELNRLKKAQKLADFIAKSWMSDEPDDHELDALQEMSVTWWEAISKHAEVNPPSPASIDLVISLLRSRLEEPDESDPFDFAPHAPGWTS